MRWVTPVANGIAVVETRAPADFMTDTVNLISSRADRVLATHRFKPTMRAVPMGEPPVSLRAETLMSLAGSEQILAARLADGRVRLLDASNSLKARYEKKFKDLGVVALSGQALYAYLTSGTLQAYDVSNAGSPALLWSRRIPKVPDPKGIVIDGERIIVHGEGLTEVWTNNTHPPTYFRVLHRWTTLERVIVNGDMIYAYNNGGTVCKLMTLRLVRPR